MDTQTTEYGFDAPFVDDVPDYLHCPVCQLVLRDPVMVIACGHKFCDPCFARMENHATAANEDLRCPTCRGVIDTAQVCADHHLRRVVGCIRVRCFSSSNGCDWEGELSELSTHEQNCPDQHPNTDAAVEDNEVHEMITSLQYRVQMWEESFLAKEDEMNQLKDLVREKSDQLDQLTQKNLNNEEDLRLLREDLRLLREEREEDKEKLTELAEKYSRAEENLKVLMEQRKNDEVALYELTLKYSKVEESLRRMENQRKEYNAERLNEVLQKGVIDQNNVNNSGEKTGRGISTATDGKKISLTLKQYIGDPVYSTISDNNVVEFHYLSTVALPAAIVTNSGKAYYEVTFKGKLNDDWDALSWIGWATSKLEPSQKHEKKKYVGVGRHSWSWNGQNQKKYHKSRCRPWGKKMEVGDDHVVGVALNMDFGQLLYSCDGVWDCPVGVAFNNIDTNLELFPAVTGFNLKVQVNFGEREFRYSPPEASYEKP